MSTAKKNETELNDEFNIDRALDRLEEINDRLGAQDIPLNESIELYKEGTILASKCKEQLQGIEKELKILNKDE
ncbi:MAG: exodeoxyribonuclease VII small subunit [Lachnospiraceae bacterium]|nr:exodeoxyribonuclease VII small subunit [Lachnospiraceae bacterium]